MRGRRIAFDFGHARIGVAQSDPDALVVTPLGPIAHHGHMDAIRALIGELEPIHIYVGLPLHLSGNEGESAQAAREFAASLKVFEIPVTMVDERLSTKLAQSRLHGAGRGTRESKSLIDSAAAAAILEHALAMEKQ